MTSAAGRAERRVDALSKERIVRAAIAILDADGEEALTFRALAARLATGPGAIYHHVANKDELLTAATDEVVAATLARAGEHDDPRETVRAVALGIYDAIEAHPWVGSSIALEPLQIATTRILERFGRPLEPLGVPQGAWFDVATTLFSAVQSAAAQQASVARFHRPGSRTATLGAVADRWQHLDPAEFPFVHGIADRMADHDDRAQFLAGIDLILAGLAALR